MDKKNKGYSRRTFIKQSSIVGLGAMTGLKSFSEASSSSLLSKNKKHVVFLTKKGKFNYGAHRTIPKFAKMLEQDVTYQTTVLLGEGEDNSFRFPGIEAIKDADLLVVFCRRVAISIKQMNIIQGYLKGGNPLLGIRTANHAFSVRDKVAEGHVSWWGFVSDMLGVKNRGYAPVNLGFNVSLVDEHKNHPILQGVNGLDGYHSPQSLYYVTPMLHDEINVLIKGTVKVGTNPITREFPDKKVEPIAWTRTTDYGGQVFYTSLGPSPNFKNAAFLQLLKNVIQFLIKK